MSLVSNSICELLDLVSIIASFVGISLLERIMLILHNMEFGAKKYVKNLFLNFMTIE